MPTLPCLIFFFQSQVSGIMVCLKLMIQYIHNQYQKVFSIRWGHRPIIKKVSHRMGARRQSECGWGIIQREGGNWSWGDIHIVERWRVKRGYVRKLGIVVKLGLGERTVVCVENTLVILFNFHNVVLKKHKCFFIVQHINAIVFLHFYD